MLRWVEVSSYNIHYFQQLQCSIFYLFRILLKVNSWNILFSKLKVVLCSSSDFFASFVYVTQVLNLQVLNLKKKSKNTVIILMLRQKEADIFFSKENEWLICRLKLICNIYNLHNVFRHRINTRKGICYAPVYGVATCISIRTFISVWQVFVKSWCKLYHFGEPDFTPGCL